MASDPPKVFISYSHDNREHCDQVLAFTQQLRRDGINAELDQFHREELLHWPRWCEEQLCPENSKYVLCVCTAEYLARVENRVGAEVGKGVFWEGRLICDYIYDAKGNNRFVPIFLGAEGDDCVPRPLRGYTRFRLTTSQRNDGDPDYEGLYRLLIGEPKVKPALLGKIPERKTDFMRIIKDLQRNLPERNPFFTGREPVLAQLQEALAARGRAALGGVGKTQTAVEYVHRHLDEYVCTFWATAPSREALVSAYLTVAGLLNLPESDTQDQMLAVEAVKRWLGSQEGWLLILDNADDIGTAREFIPLGKNRHVLLTTRAQATGAVARRVDIQEMGTEEVALFLLRRGKYIAEDEPLHAAAEDDQTHAKEIAARIDGLPLALDQAGAYIEETGCGISGYLELYRSHALELCRNTGWR